MKQGSKSSKNYYTFVKGRREELPFPQDFATWKCQTEQLKVVSFLSGLDAHYGSAKNQLLYGSELPSLNVAFSRLSWIPVHHDALSTADSMALASFPPPSPGAPTAQGRGSGQGGVGRGGGAASCGGERSSVKKEDRYCDN